jgi:hypothetical protein
MPSKPLLFLFNVFLILDTVYGILKYFATVVLHKDLRF